jgi:NADH-ubiquinone oxidoreductase chain 2
MLILSILSLIMSNAVNNRRDSSIIFNRISIFILVSCLLILNNTFFNKYILNGVILFNGLLCIENYIIVFKDFIIILTILIICINSVFPFKIIPKLYKDATHIEENKDNNKDKKHIINNYMAEQYRILEYPLIILFCITGAVFLISSFDIISIFLSIELQSYALYLICSIYRNSESSISAGLTYFLLGGLSSCIILLGISLIYINSGTTNLENIYIINNIFDFFTHYILYYSSLEPVKENFVLILDNFSILFTQYLYIQISLIIMSIGFLFKISSAPFHF